MTVKSMISKVKVCTNLEVSMIKMFLNVICLIFQQNQDEESMKLEVKEAFDETSQVLEALISEIDQLKQG